MSVHGVNYLEKDFVQKKLRGTQNDLATLEDTTENLNQGLSNGSDNLTTRNDALKQKTSTANIQAPGTHYLTAISKNQVSGNVQ